jgi:hypothetical protein
VVKEREDMHRSETRSLTRSLRLSEDDLQFLIETASPEVRDREAVKRVLRVDADFRKKFVAEERVFRRVMNEEEWFMRISPPLFFEILLRKAAADLKHTSYTLEKTSSMTIPVFDTREVTGLLQEDAVLVYLADMLASFTKIHSYAFSFRVKPGTWRKIRFSDFDLHSLKHFCEFVDDPYRFGLYKRIADICLFILGVFPDYAEADARYPSSRRPRPPIRGMPRIGPEEYEKEGRNFYRLAAEHPAARDLSLADVFEALHQDFHKARKPLAFIAEHYLRYRRQQVFM